MIVRLNLQYTDTGLDKDKIIAKLIKRVEVLERQNTMLCKEVAELQHRLSKYEHPKNSNNSSVPPSKDENRPRRNQSLRKKTGRKPGGQKGRKGNTLKMIECPDFVEKHIPDFCSCCGKDISSHAGEFVGRRQLIDIPEISYHVHEHQIFSRTCTCGHQTISQYPIEANAPVSYGNKLECLIGYLHARQYIPFKRMEEFIKDVFNLPISEGGIHYLLNKLVIKARPAYELIREKLTAEDGFAVGADETGIKVCGNKHWAWTWQNDEATFISITDNRAGESITKNFPDGFEKSVLVHDCWKSHFNTNALSHQICIAHLLRDLNYLSELYNHKWSRICKMIFKSALGLEKKMSKADYYVNNPARQSLEKRLNILLNYSMNENDKELVTFQKRLIKYRDYIFVFLYRPEVPPDNNASERAIRNIKVKQKISGQFKSPDGVFGFAVLRSITDTIIKNNQNVLNSLKVIANLHTD